MMKEFEVGKVTHYYTKIKVAAVKILNSELKIGDKIHIKGHTTDLNQIIESMQKEHKEIEVANPGDEIGIEVIDHVREGDIVYKVIEE